MVETSKSTQDLRISELVEIMHCGKEENNGGKGPDEEQLPTTDYGADQLTCRVVTPGGQIRKAKQGLPYFEGISRETVGARGICMHLVIIPPGSRANAHLHEDHETAIYVLSGESEMRYGESLQHHLLARKGEFVYIPSGMPHLPANPSSSEPCVVVLARTDPSEQESVVLLPGLDSTGNGHATQTVGLVQPKEMGPGIVSRAVHMLWRIGFEWGFLPIPYRPWMPNYKYPEALSPRDRAELDKLWMGL